MPWKIYIQIFEGKFFKLCLQAASYVAVVVVVDYQLA